MFVNVQSMNKTLWAGVAIAAVATGCTSEASEELTQAPATRAAAQRAIAVLTPTEGNQVSGTAKFVQTGDQVTITINLEGLEPNSVHAWHVHEYGNVSGPDGKATGGHYNPEGHDHALPPEAERHAGDLGNVKADANGNVDDEITVDNLTIDGDKNPIVGRGLIIHADTDDGGQPTGNAGARIAQAVIGVDAEP